MVPKIWVRLRWPMYSMMSISPELGQLTDEMLLPSIQKAGQTPWFPALTGRVIPASMRPYWVPKRMVELLLPAVVDSRPVVTPLGAPAAARATIARLPLPSRKTLGLLGSQPFVACPKRQL